MDTKSLLICADARTVQVLTGILEENGLGVEHCSDASSAMSLASTNQFHVIFVDCQVETEPGGLISQLREAPFTKKSVLVAILENGAQIRNIRTSGANFVLFKPITSACTRHNSVTARSKPRSERRLRPRIPLHAKGSIAYASTENEDIKVLDLSEDGIAIRSGKSLPRDCKVYFQFSLPGEAATVRLSSEVIWQNESSHVGLRFADVPKSSRATLNRWISTNVAGKLQVTQTDASSEESFSMNFLIQQLGLISAASPERRQRPRCRCSIGAEVYRAGSHVQQRCTVTDISEGGCYVQTSEPMPVGTEIEIVLRTEDLKLKMHGKVQSVHRGMGMGVHLKVADPAHARQLQQLMSRVEKLETVSFF